MATYPGASAVAAEFISELDRAIGPLQRAVHSLITRAAATLGSPSELARGLAIPKMQAWNMWRLAHARAPQEAAMFVVGATALKNFLAAGARYGADAALLEAVRYADNRYREFVRQTARDEGTLRLMVEAASGAEGRVEPNINQHMFDANRFRIGVQTSSRLACYILFPGQLERCISAAGVRSLGECRWLRPDGRAVVRFGPLTASELDKDTGAPIVHLATPLDPELASRQRAGQGTDLPHLPAFCSGDSTVLFEELVADTVIYSIRPRRMGANHTTTLCFGEIKHDCFLPLEAEPRTAFAVSSTLPTEHLVTEVYVHRDLVQQGFVFRPLITDTLFRPVETRFWAPRINVATLGGTFQAIEPTETIDSPVSVPPYRELIEFTFDRIDHQRRDFFCYRMRLPTPPLGLSVTMVAGDDPEPVRTRQIL